jgi:hypothetical protein
MRRLIQMDFEQTEILETTPEYFLQWLEAEVKALRFSGTNSLEFREAEKTTYVTLQHPHTTMKKLEIVASATVVKDGEKASWLHKWGVVMEFVVKQLNNNEIQLIAGYRSHPRIKDYFDILWTGILNVFPRRSITEQDGARSQDGIRGLENENSDFESNKLKEKPDLEYETLPHWWPQNEATKRKWKAEMKKISPLLRQGKNNTEIAEALQMKRKRVGRIITWWTKDTSAHI